MFTKNNVSKSMIDAVESVLAEDKKLLLEPEAEKKDRKKNDDRKQDVAEGHQDDSKEREENLRYSRSRNPVADAIRKKLNPNQKEQNKKESVAEGLTEMDKSQTPPGRDGGTQFPPGPKVSKKDREAVKKDPVKHLNNLFAKEYDKKDVKEELKGNQVKLDKNHNGKLDAQDFKLLRMKKEEILNSMKPGAKKVAKQNEEVEQIDELKKSTLASYAKKATDDVSYHSFSAGSRSEKDPERLKDDEKSMKRQAGVSKAIDRLAKEEVETVEENIGAMMSVVDEDKGKKAIRVDTLKGPTTTTDPEVKNANAHFSGKKATLKAEGKGTDTAVPFVTDSVSPTHREINKAVKPTFKKIKEMLGKTGTGESELPANAQLPG